MKIKAKDILRYCENKKWKISDYLLHQQETEEGLSQEEVFQQMREIWSVMKEAGKKGVTEEVHSLSGLIGGNAKRIYDRRDQSLLGENLSSAMAYAVSTSEVNSSMGKIVAAPTAGAAGILPGVLLSYEEAHDVSEEDIYRAMLTATEVGIIIAANATLSGAEGGCQAECGSAAAMAAAALVELEGGTPAQCFHAAGFALINIMGLICDPVMGLVEYPCYLRNASGVLNAYSAAELSLSKAQALVDFDDVVVAMKQVGDSLPASLRETALGGIAACYQCNGNCGT